MGQRAFKDPLYREFARIGNAVASPKRIELLDLLSQSERTVEQLARQTVTPLKNTSAHLKVLRHARLVETRREGTHVIYRLAGDDVGKFIRDLQLLARSRLTEVRDVTAEFIDSRDALEPITLQELRRRMRAGDVTVIDVRPAQEFRAGHIPGAVSLPLDQLRRRMPKLPRSREVIAYCRGPYCMYSLEAIQLLRKRGYRARRAQAGVPHWRAQGLPVAIGA